MPEENANEAQEEEENTMPSVRKQIAVMAIIVVGITVVLGGGVMLSMWLKEVWVRSSFDRVAHGLQPIGGAGFRRGSTGLGIPAQRFSAGAPPFTRRHEVEP